MQTIIEIKNKYQGKIDLFDLELLIAHAIKKSREFVLAHPQYKLSSYQTLRSKYHIWQRSKKKPIAYIVGHKEFYGLDFKVNKNVLIPRPETELLVGSVFKKIVSEKNKKKILVVDVGTGSGNIIISLAKKLQENKSLFFNYQLLAFDISSQALAIAKYNAKKNKVNKKIKFIKSNLLNYFLKNKKELFKIIHYKLIIVANLPYLSQKIYNKSMLDVKNFEPPLALLSKSNGLDHYKKLFKQIKKLQSANCKLQTFLEISPEQKLEIEQLARKYFFQPQIKFQKDLAKKWRIMNIRL